MLYVLRAFLKRNNWEDRNSVVQNESSLHRVSPFERLSVHFRRKDFPNQRNAVIYYFAQIIRVANSWMAQKVIARKDANLQIWSSLHQHFANSCANLSPLHQCNKACLGSGCRESGVTFLNLKKLAVGLANFSHEAHPSHCWRQWVKSQEKEVLAWLNLVIVN